VSAETGFIIERRDGPDGYWRELFTTAANATTYTDDTARPGTHYEYRVVATNAAGDSDPSNIAICDSMAGPAEVTFRVERKLGSGGTWSEIGTTSTNISTYEDRGVTGGHQYFYRVRARSAEPADSPYSNEATATTPGFAGTILAMNLRQDAYDETNFSLSARSITRYLRAKNRLGIPSSWVGATVNIPAPPAPTIAVDADFQFPSSFKLNITPGGGTVTANIKRTVVELSVNNFSSILVTDYYSGLARAVNVDGRQSTLPTVYVRVRFEDLFGGGTTSNTISYSFVQFGDVDIDPASQLARQVARGTPMMSGGGTIAFSSGGAFSWTSAFTIGPLPGLTPSGLITIASNSGGTSLAIGHALIARQVIGSSSAASLVDVTVSSYTPPDHTSTNFDVWLGHRRADGALVLYNGVILQPGGQVAGDTFIPYASILTAMIGTAQITNALIHDEAVDAAKIALATITFAQIDALETSSWSPYVNSTTTGDGIRIASTALDALNGAIAINSTGGGTIKGVPFTETKIRAIDAIGSDLRYRGNDTGKVPQLAILTPRLTSVDVTDDNNVRVVVAADVPDARIDASVNGDTIDKARVSVYNMFGELVTTFPPAGYSGEGVVGVGMHTRDFCDPYTFGVYKIQVHNAFGWSDPIWLTFADDWWDHFPWTYLRRDAPTNLSATAIDHQSFRLSWTFTAAVALQYRKRGEAAWNALFGVSAGTTTAVVDTSDAPFEELTWYEFNIFSVSASIVSNIAMARSKQAPTVAPTRIPPTGLVVAPDTAAPTTTIAIDWARGATDNDATEVWIDGALDQTITPGSTVTASKASLTAGSTHGVKLRNKWSSGTTYSDFTIEKSVTLKVTDATATAPSNLIITFIDSVNSEVDLAWTNNGATGTITVERKTDGGSWGTLASGLASSTTTRVDSTAVSGINGHTYYYRVKNVGTTGYTNEVDVFIDPPPDTDPYCVWDECLVLCVDRRARERFWKRMGDMALGDIVVTINPLTGRASASEVKEIRRGTVDALVRFDTEDGAAVRTSLTQPLIAGLMDRDGTKASALEVGNTLVSYGEDLESLAAENTLISELQVEEGEFPVSILGLRNVDHSFVARLPEAVSGVACHNIAVKL
jgi:hypothetical protein